MAPNTSWPSKRWAIVILLLGAVVALWPPVLGFYVFFIARDLTGIEFFAVALPLQVTYGVGWVVVGRRFLSKKSSAFEWCSILLKVSLAMVIVLAVAWDAIFVRDQLAGRRHGLPWYVMMFVFTCANAVFSALLYSCLRALKWTRAAKETIATPLAEEQRVE